MKPYEKIAQIIIDKVLEDRSLGRTLLMDVSSWQEYKENHKVIGSLGIEYYGLEDKLTEFDGYKGREIGYVLSKDYW